MTAPHALCAGAALVGIPEHVPERIRSKIEVCDETGCWLWTGARNSGGYASARAPGGETSLLHRGLWTFLRSPIEKGLHLDHLCRVRHCVNPWHLEPVTPRENIARGRLGALKTHCAQGHEYTPENVRWSTTAGRLPRRLCQVCYEIRMKEHAAKRRAATAARRG